MERPILRLPRHTQRLVLLQPSPQNAAAVQEAVEESFADLRVWMDWAKTLQSLEDIRAVLERAAACAPPFG